MANEQKHPAVFIDRDGTICEEAVYLRRLEDLRLLAGAAEAIARANQAGYKVVIISNQSGVARGYMTEETVREINRALADRLQKRGARVDGIYYCPHHPDGQPPYNIDCRCRKPEPGMLLKAEKELNLDLSRSVVIGDKLSDVETARRLNIPGILVLTGYGKNELARIRRQKQVFPDFVAEDLAAAIQWWLGRNRLSSGHSDLKKRPK